MIEGRPARVAQALLEAHAGAAIARPGAVALLERGRGARYALAPGQHDVWRRGGHGAPFRRVCDATLVRIARVPHADGRLIAFLVDDQLGEVGRPLDSGEHAAVRPRSWVDADEHDLTH